MTPEEFRGGVAVVTGAAQGIGAALVEKAASWGMKIAVCDLDADGAEQLAARLRSEQVDAIALAFDVRDAAQVEDAAAQVFQRWGSTRLLVNNAGVMTFGRIWEFTPQQWALNIDVNLNALYHTIHSFLPRMIASGQPGQVVNVASIAALGARALVGPYVAAKHACLALTETLYYELADFPQLSAAAVIPGPVATRINSTAGSAADFGDAEKQRSMAMTADLGIAPSEVADIVFAGLLRGDLWIHTHPEVSDRRIEERHLALISRRPIQASAR